MSVGLLLTGSTRVLRSESTIKHFGLSGYRKTLIHATVPMGVRKSCGALLSTCLTPRVHPRWLPNRQTLRSKIKGRGVRDSYFVLDASAELSRSARWIEGVPHNNLVHSRRGHDLCSRREC